MIVEKIMLIEIISLPIIPANLYLRNLYCSEVMGRKNLPLLPCLACVNSFSCWGRMTYRMVRPLKQLQPLVLISLLGRTDMLKDECAT